MEKEPVTLWIDALASGDDDAAARLWEHFFDRLVRVARRHLVNQRVVDEEDVAASVFHRLCAGAREGRFEQLGSRDELWRLLVTMTVRRSIDANRRARSAKRGGGRVRGDSILAGDGDQRRGGLDDFPGDALPPDFLAMVEEEHARLLQLLPDDTLRQISLWRMEGQANHEIAERLGLTTRSVERKLNRIRGIWSSGLADE